MMNLSQHFTERNPQDWRTWTIKEKLVLRDWLRAEKAKRMPAPTVPSSWQDWQQQWFPFLFTAPLAQHHKQCWDWIWGMPKDSRPSAFVGIWARGGGKSSTAEPACVAVGALRRRKYGIYLCHEKGTIIFDPNRPEDGWLPVEQHITARSIEREGLTVEIAGLPMVTASESVTPEHRYWARRVATRQKAKEGQETFYGEPHWIEAQHLDWNTWIGHPIDQSVIDESELPLLGRWNGVATVETPFPLFSSPEFWWVIGLWWGDGTLGGERGSQITFACSDDHPSVKSRLIKNLSQWGYNPKESRPSDGSRQASVRFCDSVLGRWLKTWKHGNSRKEPPVWVEKLSHECQRQLILGYLAADGYLSLRGAHLKSIHLPGLLIVRRILARLGVCCNIGSCRSPGEGIFPSGKTYRTARCYILRIEHPAPLGIPNTARSRKKDLTAVFIRDGFLWSKIANIKNSGIRTFIPITTASSAYLTAYGLSHNCGTQQQSDDHVQNIARLLESPTVARFDKALSERRLGKYGSVLGWRRNRLQTASGLTIDAMGLDSSIRGAKIDEQRPDFIILDDIDAKKDSQEVAQKKIDTVTHSIIPAGARNLAILAIQNLPNRHGFFAKIADGSAEYLRDHILVGPIPALLDFKYTPRDGKFLITHGIPTWEGQDLASCQALLNDIGPVPFRVEAQHDLKAALGKVFKRTWFPVLDAAPTAGTAVRFWDLAATDDDGDYTVGILMRKLPSGAYVIEDQIRFQGSPLSVEQSVLMTAKQDGYSVRVGLYQDPAQAGKYQAQTYVKKLAGYVVNTYPTTHNVGTLAGPVASQAEAGNISMVRGKWNNEFLSETEEFPDGAHDDIIAALAGAFMDLVSTKTAGTW